MSIFDDRDQARCWIITNQLSRRNLSLEQITFLIRIKYKLEKKEQTRDPQDHFEPRINPPTK